MSDLFLKIRGALIRNLSPEKRDLIKRAVRPMAAYLFRKDLTKLAIMHGTDKYGAHWYIPHYEMHFRKYRKKRINLLEIGVGGDSDTTKGGASLRMWKSYFRGGNIHGADLYDKSKFEEKRIRIFQCDQSDEVGLQEVVSEIGEVDIIIDDGSHINAHIIKTFEVLFPHLRKGGLYVVEDLQTSYWPEYGGDSENLANLETAMGYFKSMVDGLNHQEFMLDGYKPTYFDKNIISMHFYHNLLFIYKGDNNEESNVIEA